MVASVGLGLTLLSVPSLQEGPQWLHVRDFDRLLRESQREVLRLQRQIALRNQQEPPPPLRPQDLSVPAKAGVPAPGAPGEVSARVRAGVWVCAGVGCERPWDPFPLESSLKPGEADVGVRTPRVWRAFLARGSPPPPKDPGFRPPETCAPRGQPGRPCCAASGTAQQQIPGCPGSRPGPSPCRLLPSPPPQWSGDAPFRVCAAGLAWP